MNKELQDKAWSVLPKEFKEEVKKLYREYTFTREGYYTELFGLHNLTSDAEGEEMLTVPRKDVMNHFREVCLDRIYYSKDSKDYAQATGRKIMLVRLFGKDKCLPDDKADDKADGNENSSNVDSLSQNPPENCDNGNLISIDDNKPSEPKFKVGDKVVYIGENQEFKGRLFEIDGEIFYNDYHRNMQVSSIKCKDYNVCNVPLSDLEPYVEPEEKSRNLSQETANCDKHFDNILKDSFRNERRLNIAVQLASAMIPKYQDNVDGIGLSVLNEKDMIKCAYRIADYLIAECEKGGKSWF